MRASASPVDTLRCFRGPTLIPSAATPTSPSPLTRQGLHGGEFSPMVPNHNICLAGRGSTPCSGSQSNAPDPTLQPDVQPERCQPSSSIVSSIQATHHILHRGTFRSLNEPEEDGMLAKPAHIGRPPYFHRRSLRFRELLCCFVVVAMSTSRHAPERSGE
ncbi:hypothetical protein BV20DRAFT_37686 [Pilatotrama ljubarskyi]|nr:hypothetical protein BV20DRAFT_37686 [Pilatotrama ljubarskyi]